MKLRIAIYSTLVVTALFLVINKLNEKKNIEAVRNVGGNIIYDDPTFFSYIFKKRIRKIDFMYSNITDLKFLGNLNVESILLNDSKVTSLNGIEKVKSLEKLLLNNCKIDNISEVEQLKNLKYIILKGTKVTDIKVLTFLPSLEIINLQEINLVDQNQLLELQNPKTLWLYDTNVTKELVSKLQIKFPDCEINH